MFKRKCHECGKQMFFKVEQPIKPFCCKECSDKWHERDYNDPKNGPVMPRLKKENITDEGYVAIVKAIIGRAGRDVSNFKPGTRCRVLAEEFFRTEYFAALTGLDGEAVLRDLQKSHKERKRGGLRMRKVLCVETGVEYESINAAAADHNVHSKTLFDALHGRGYTADGLHWKFVEE